MIKDLTQFRLLEESAELLLMQYGKHSNTVIQPPIPVENIANALGYKCLTGHLDKLNKGASGALLKEEKIIIVNKNDSFERKRFSIAHEVGHLVLPGFGNPSDCLHYGYESISHPEKRSYLEEVACNKFAGALIMPIFLLQKEIEKYNRINDVTVLQLANTFNVSALAMLIRIDYLVYYLTQIPNIDWDSLENIRAHFLSKPVQETAFSSAKPVYEKNDLIYYTESPFILQIVTNKLLKLGLVEVAYRNGKEMKTEKSPREKLGKPLVIEFSGTPNGGKDTQIQILADYLRDYKRYKVAVINELYDSSRVYPGSSDKLYWMVGSTIKNLVEIKNEQKLDVILINRGLFDLLAMIDLYHDQGYISKKELRSLSASLSTKKLCDIEDVVIFIKTTPEISIQREKIYPRNSVAGLAEKLDQWDPNPKPALTNQDGLLMMNKCYEKAMENYAKAFKDIYSLDDQGDVTIDDAAITIGMHIQPLFPDDIINTFKDELFIRRPKTKDEANQLSFSEILENPKSAN